MLEPVIYNGFLCVYIYIPYYQHQPQKFYISQVLDKTFSV